MTYALQKAPASIVSPFNYTGIVWAIIFDYLIWNSHPIISTIVGGFIITISGIYIFKREAKIKERRGKKEKSEKKKEGKKRKVKRRKEGKREEKKLFFLNDWVED